MFEVIIVKLVEFVNEYFLVKFGDGKYKEKFDKYGRVLNCVVIVLIVKFEIWDKYVY